MNFHLAVTIWIKVTIRFIEVLEKNKKIGHVIVRISPIMEILTGIMIAVLIFYSGKLIANEELSVNNFFSFRP